MISRIVGGAESVCVLALQDAVLAAAQAPASEPQQRREAAIEAFTERLGKEVDLSFKCNQKHYDKIVAVLRGLPPVVEPKIDVEALLNTTLDDINLDDDNIFAKGDDDISRFLSAKGQELANAYASSGKPFFMERVQYVSQDRSMSCLYLAIGTSSGKHPKFPGQDFNVFCTTGSFRTIRDAGEDLVVHAGGRQLTKSADRDGRSYFIRFLPITDESRVWRFWASTNKNGIRKDVDQLRFSIRPSLTAPKGYDVIRMSGSTIDQTDRA
jgi:hypothetical protein